MIVALLPTANARKALNVNVRPNYDLHVRLLPDKHLMEVEGQLGFVADTQIETVTLRLAKNMGPLKLSVVEPKEFAGEAVVTGKKDDANTTDYTFRLPIPIAANYSVKLSFSYAGGEKPTFTFYLGPEVSFACGPGVPWYPQLVGSDARGIGVLTFETPMAYQVVASGVRLDGNKAGTTSFRVSVPQTFSFSCARYSVVRRQGKVPVSIYLLRQRENIDAYLDGAVRVLDNLIKEFGAYPYGEFAMAEIPEEQASGFGGASTTGLVLATSASFDAPFNLPFFAHEFSHQWWGNLVTVDGEPGLFMLSEGMAQYGSLKTVETIAGPEAAERYRKTGYPGYDPNQDALGYFKYAAADMDHPLAFLPEKTGLLSHELACTKGFLVLDLLSRTVGPVRFRHALQKITSEYAFHSIKWEDFLSLVEKESGQELHWFYDQWFERTGAPDFHLEWQQMGQQLKVVITQHEPFYRAKLPLEGYGEGCKVLSQTVAVDGPRTEVRLKVNFEVKRAALDPHLLVLHWTPEFRSEANALRFAFHANFERIQGNLEEALKEFEAAHTSLPRPDRFGVTFAIEEGLARVNMLKRNWPEAKANLMAALSAPSRPPNTLPWVYYRLATVAQSLSDPELFRWAVNGAVSSDALLQVPTGAGDAARKLGPAK